ncbi:MAG: hypothetical protein KF696_04735 [Planctomycetes bacterium]|nr:hypothetical protein [Planctomycetota bacterium]MCW8134279.1 hypothetical protein [Planctomycetota bacterium]
MRGLSRILAIAALCATAPLAAQITLSQSTDGVNIQPANTPACGNSTGTTDNSYCRAYNIATPMTATAVRIGVESDGGINTMEIKFWNYTGIVGQASFVLGSQIGNTTSFLTKGDGTWDGTVQTILLDTPVSLPAGNVLVEAKILNNQLTDGLFYFGSNTGGETPTNSSFIIAPDCNITVPTTMATVGFPTCHIILDIVGYTAAPPTPVISVRYPTGTGKRVPPTSGSIHAGTYTPGAAGNVVVQLHNHGPTGSITVSSVNIGTQTNCTVGSITLPGAIAAGTSQNLTIPVTPSAGIGTFSFNVTVNSNAANQSAYAFTVNGGRGMTGTFTVIPAGGGNYTDIGAAFDDLEACGMVGPVIIEVADGTYTPTMSYGLGSQGSLAKTPIYGNSSVNTITIQAATGANPIIDGGGFGPFIDGLAGNGTGCMSFHGLTSITVEGLTFRNGADFGLFVTGSKENGSIARNATIRRCTFHNISNGPGLAIVHDYYSYNNVTVENNMVYSCGAGNSAYLGALRGAIAVWHPGTNGLYQHNTILHNAAQGTAISGCLGFTAGNVFLAINPTVSFNVFSVTSNGMACYVFRQAASGTPTTMPSVADRNVVHYGPGCNAAHGYGTGGTAPIAAVTYATLANWRAAYASLNVNSIDSDPNLVSSTDVHLQTTSPAIDLAVGSTVTIDRDGDTRPIGTAPDAGADERAGGGAGGSLNITTTTLPDAVELVAYSTPVTATASGLAQPFTWSLVGAPGWLGITGTTLTATLSGTPPAASANTYNFDLVITKGTVSDTQAVSLTVLPSGTLIITTTSLPSGTVGVGYNQTIQASGGTGGYVWTLDVGPLPAGLNLDMAATGLSTTLTGTPTTAGTYPFTVRITDSLAATDPQAYTLVINNPPGPIGKKKGGSGGGGCSSGGGTAPWMLLGLIPLALLAVYRRRSA